MKKINNAYLATAKDGSLEKIMAELPDNSGGYAGFFTDLDPKFIEKALKNLSETEENIHPAMLIPLAFIFQNPLFQISKDLREVAGGKSLQERMIDDFLTHTQEWLYANEVMTMELYDFCPDIEKIPLDETHTIVKNIYITPEIEKNYLELAVDRQDRIKRTKILAAVNALLTHRLLSDAISQENAKEAAEYMFLFTRSMVQFAANKAVDDGLSRQEARRKGGEREADRTGLLRLIRKYHAHNPTATDAELWKIITHDLLHKSVRFEFEPTDDRITGGSMIQKKSGGEEYPMCF